MNALRFILNHAVRAKSGFQAGNGSHRLCDLQKKDPIASGGVLRQLPVAFGDLDKQVVQATQDIVRRKRLGIYPS
jgi:hypothetical protein